MCTHQFCSPSGCVHPLGVYTPLVCTPLLAHTQTHPYVHTHPDTPLRAHTPRCVHTSCVHPLGVYIPFVRTPLRAHTPTRSLFTHTQYAVTNSRWESWGGRYCTSVSEVRDTPLCQEEYTQSQTPPHTHTPTHTHTHTHTHIAGAAGIVPEVWDGLLRQEARGPGWTHRTGPRKLLHMDAWAHARQHGYLNPKT